MHQNTERLRGLMARHNLKARDVAAVVRREPVTVAIWRCASDNRVIPSELLELVELKYAAKRTQAA